MVDYDDRPPDADFDDDPREPDQESIAQDRAREECRRRERAAINGLDDIAMVEDRRYPGGGIGFRQQADDLRRRLR